MSFRNPFKPVHLTVASIAGLLLGIGLGLLRGGANDGFLDLLARFSARSSPFGCERSRLPRSCWL